MNLTALFIRRPVMTALVMSGILIFGVAGYRGLPVSDLPTIDYPSLSVSASLPGASPETMAASVATLLERQFSTISGLDSMTSTSARGSTQISLQFSLDRDIDAANQDVQSAIAQVSRRLPSGMPNPPTVSKGNQQDQAMLTLSINSPTLALTQVQEYADTLVAPRISTLTGVSQVQVIGQTKYAVRVQLDPNQLAYRGIGVDEVSAAINRHNVNLPAGTLWGPQQVYTVQANGQVMNADEFRPLVITYRNGSPVRVGDVATVTDGIQNDKEVSWYNTEPGHFTKTRSISMQVQRQPGANLVEAVDRVKALLPEFRAQLPPSVNLDVVYDRSVSIRESVDDVKVTLVLAVVLVVGVIFLFLRNISATLIPSLALPISIVGTFAAMSLMGHSLDNLSLMALTLSVGFVVDDAIVVLENIVRHMEMGKSRMEAALEGGKEIAFTVLSMTLSLCAVFIPVLFMGGILGRLFNEFALVIMVAILTSGFVSLSLTPMLCSRFLSPPGEKHGFFYNVTERVFDGIRDFYKWSLGIVIRHRLATITVFLCTIGATAYLFQILPTGFIPSQDTGQLSGQVEFAQDASFDQMVRLQGQVSEVVAENPNVEAFTVRVGAGGGYGSGGRLQLRLKSRDERTATPEQVIEELRPKLAGIAGVRAFFTNPPIIRIGGAGGRSLYQFTLQSQDLPSLYKASADFEKTMKEIPGISDVSSDLQTNSPLLMVDIDRDLASSVGVTADQIETALFSAYGSRQVSSIYTPTNDYQVIMELQPKYQQDPNALNLLYVRSAAGKLIPLSALTQMRTTVGPLQVTHLGQLPSITISFSLAPGVSLGEAVEKVQEAARLTLPDTIRTVFQGTAAAFQSSIAGMGMLVLLAILVIYLVLGILYESFIHPITILSGLPSAGLGALVTLWLFKSELNVYSYVGVIMLIGIVKKNAIMMIDFAVESQRQHNVPPADAIFEACIVRFRPILMTTMAALVGTLPIALGLGAGSEARRPLGLAVVGGLVVSQLLTLYITPVFYIYMEKFVGLFESKKGKALQVQPVPAESATQ